MGISAAGYRCLFFLLFEDYIDAQGKFVQDLDKHLERFARKVGKSAALVRPFTGDIEQTRQNVLDKPWSEEEQLLICRTPALLIIDRDFDDFDPRCHPWVHLHFGKRLEDGYMEPDEASTHAVQLANTLQVLADTVNSPGTDIFEVARNLQTEVNKVGLRDVEEVVEVKPGAFGISINLVQGAKVLRKLYSQLRYRRRQSHRQEAGN